MNYYPAFSRLKKTLLFSLFSSVALYSQALAQTKKPNCGDPEGTYLPGCTSGTTDFEGIKNDFIPRVITYLVGIIGVIAVIMIMYGGVVYLTSMGDDAKTKKANKILFYAIFGIIMSLVSYIAVQIVVNLEFVNLG